MWVTSADEKSAEYHTVPGAAQVTLPIPGTLVGGDTKAAYVQITGQDATGSRAANQLWRYPIDGSAPTMLAYSPTVDQVNYSFFDDPLPLTNGHGVLKVWESLIDSSRVPWVLLQWVPK